MKRLDIDREELSRRPYEVDQYFVEAIAKGIVVLSGDCCKDDANKILIQASQFRGRARFWLQKTTTGYKLTTEPDKKSV